MPPTRQDVEGHLGHIQKREDLRREDLRRVVIDEATPQDHLDVLQGRAVLTTAEPESEETS